MTKKEAIEVLQNIAQDTSEFYSEARYFPDEAKKEIEALTIAIEAITKEIGHENNNYTKWKFIKNKGKRAKCNCCGYEIKFDWENFDTRCLPLKCPNCDRPINYEK